jgi:aspartyl protease family protein
MKQPPSPPSFNKVTIIIIWIVLLGATTLLFNNVLDKINNPNQKLTISVNEGGQKQVVLKRNKYGHYVATGSINNYPVTFLLDTGATLVAIPQHIAAEIGLPKGRRFQTQTANGNSTSYSTKLDSLSLGGIVMNNVPASISTGMKFDEILLGMSFLKHLQLTQQGNTLTISIPE